MLQNHTKPRRWCYKIIQRQGSGAIKSYKTKAVVLQNHTQSQGGGATKLYKTKVVVPHNHTKPRRWCYKITQSQGDGATKSHKAKGVVLQMHTKKVYEDKIY